MKPFAEEATTISLGDLSIENGIERISIHGSLDIDRSASGLERARQLASHAASIVAALEAIDDLPQELVEATKPTRKIHNPLRG